jgi:hypothetical protein
VFVARAEVDGEVLLGYVDPDEDHFYLSWAGVGRENGTSITSIGQWRRTWPILVRIRAQVPSCSLALLAHTSPTTVRAFGDC